MDKDQIQKMMLFYGILLSSADSAVMVAKDLDSKLNSIKLVGDKSSTNIIEYAKAAVENLQKIQGLLSGNALMFFESPEEILKIQSLRASNKLN
jgi:hypothetical protein